MSMKSFTDPKDLVVAAMGQIEMRPETWDQASWKNDAGDCGTTYCLAGWMAQIDGQQWGDDESLITGPTTRTGVGEWAVGEWACHVLAPSDKGATIDRLFDPDNTLDMLRAGVKAYLNNDDVGVAIERAKP